MTTSSATQLALGLNPPRPERQLTEQQAKSPLSVSLGPVAIPGTPTPPAPTLPWSTHAASCAFYLVDAVCDCETLLLVLDSPALPDGAR